eukprot:gene6570-3222_t
MQPLYNKDLKHTAEVIASNLNMVQSEYTKAAAKVLRGDMSTASSLADALAYLLDTATSLSSFLACHKAAASIMLLRGQAGQGALLNSLADLYCNMVPQLAHALKQPAAAAACGLDPATASRQVQLLAVGIKKTAFQLLQAGFLEPLEDVVSGGKGASASKAQEEADHRGDDLMAVSMAASQLGEAGHRGDDLMAVSMAASQLGVHSGQGASMGGESHFLSDIKASYGLDVAVALAIKQLWPRSCRGSSNQAGEAWTGLNSRSPVSDMNASYGLEVAVALAIKQGQIALDEPQLDYLMVLIGSDRGSAEGQIALDEPQLDYLMVLIGADRISAEAMAHAQFQSLHPHSTPGAGGSGASGSSSRTAVGAAGGSGSGAGGCGSGAGASGSGAAGGSGAGGLDPAGLASMILQIKDVLPDYGDGFLTACLVAYKQDPAQVIDRLLEGGPLHPDVMDLDKQLAVWAGPSHGEVDVRGKGPAWVPGGASASSSQPSWGAIAADSSAWHSQQKADMAASASSRVPQPTKAVTRPGGRDTAVMHRGVARVLGRVDEKVKDTTRMLAEELQFEYDDEYDDSFDDLLQGAAEDPARAEGDGGRTRAMAMLRSLVASAWARRCLGLGTTLPWLGHDVALAWARRWAAVKQPELRPEHGGSRPRQLLRLEQRPRQYGPAKPAGQPEPQIHHAGSADVEGDDTSSTKPRLASASDSSLSSSAASVASAAASTRPAAAAQGGRGGAGGRGGGRGKAAASKSWVLDGRIYNYPKPGAREVTGQAETDQALEENRMAAQEIMGLGAGGNVPIRPPKAGGGGGDGGEGDESGEEDGGGGGPGWGGRGGGRGGAGRGRGAPSHARNEKNKSAVGNHHRKDRAARKQGMF